MNVWLIKHKGANYWGNYTHDREITIDDKIFYAQLCFYRRKDAQAYLKAKEYSDFYEVVKFTSRFKGQDNRFSKTADTKTLQGGE